VLIQVKSVGQVLFNNVVQKLDLLESDYFDLEYTNVHGISVSTNSLIQRVPEAVEYVVYFSHCLGFMLITVLG